MNRQSDNYTGDERTSSTEDDDSIPAARRPLVNRLGRVALLFFVIPVLAILIGGAGLFYVFQGQDISSETIDSRIHSTVQDLLGDDYTVSIGNTGLSLISSSALSLTASGVEIHRTTDDLEVARLEYVRVGLNLLSMLRGNPQFDKVSIDGGRLDASVFGNEPLGPVSIQSHLKKLAASLNRVEETFTGGSISSIELTEIEISSLGLARRKTGPVMLKQVDMALDQDRQVAIIATLESEASQLEMSAKWRSNVDDGRQLSLGIGGLNLAEWFEPASADPQNTRGVGLEGVIRLDARIPFDAEMRPGEPFAKAQGGNGRFRLGRNTAVDVESLVVSLRLEPETGRIAIEPSDLSAGGRKLSLSGNVTPFSEDGRFAGLLGFDLAVRGEVPVTKASQDITVSGSFDTRTNFLALDNIIADTGGEMLTGYLGLDFAPDTSPGLNGQLRADKLSLPSLYASWPFNAAPKLKLWAQENLSDGDIVDLNLRFAVPPGRFARIADESGAPDRGFEADEFVVSSRFRGMRIRTPGELPALQDASGELSVTGRQVTITAQDASLNAGKPGKVRVAEARLEIPNSFAPGIPAQLKGKLEGPLAAVATVADREPLRIARNLAIVPSQLTGNARVDLDLAFDIESDVQSRAVDWNARVALAGAGSKAKLFERRISNADMVIEARNQMIRASGTANIDGFDANLDIVEPINNGDESARKRDITLNVTHTDLAKQGIDLGPVVKGRLGVKIATASAQSNSYDIDLTNAEIFLPWIAWRKGAKIPARASFVLDQNNGRNTLREFRFSGDKGRKASGNLVFDKSGLISARLTGVSLHGNDSFNVTVSRKSGRFEITTDGKMFDGRALINQIIHEDGLNSGEAGNDVTVTANFGSLVGFDGNMLTNSLVRYRTDGGLLTELTVNGAFNNEPASIEARRNGGTTSFDFYSRDAGAALAMVNIYQKMRGGRLKASLTRSGNGPFTGNVDIKNFIVSDEQRLESLVFAPVSDKELERASGKLRELNVKRVHFDRLEAFITKSEGYFGVKNGTIRNAQIGLTFDGVLYDQSNRMNVRGTFMPLFSVSRLIGGIPILGEILSGKGGLIGITYRLRGAANNPQILVNPVSVIAPGIFRQIFQFQP